jgi:transcriptional regulator with XRE-family HTH domain
MPGKSPDPTDIHVGSRVRMRRLMLGMSQGRLASRLGLTFQQVQKYEKGTNRISASRLQAIAHILVVPVSFFFDRGPHASGSAGKGGRNPSPAHLAEFLANAEGRALVRAFLRIKDAEMRRLIVRAVEDISSGS